MSVKNECLINGIKQSYSVCSTSTLQEAKKVYKRKNGWIYIGSSHTTFHNGFKNIRKEEYHFFNRE